MNCRDWEERIALYAGGDQAPAETAEIEQHLTTCAGCRGLWSELQGSLDGLRELHQEPVAPAHYAAVRSRVRSQIEGERSSRRKLVWAFGFAAVVLLAVFATWPRHGGVQVARSEPVVKPLPSHTRPAMDKKPAETAEAAPAVEIKPVHHLVKPVHRERTVRHREGPVETLMMKIETDNPDVVLYWIAEKKGD